MDVFSMTQFLESLTFDDVLLEPAYSEVLPHEVSLKTRLTRHISLSIPLISAAMDTVTESGLAIAMAQSGGIGVIHKNLTIEEQAAEIRKVKRFEAGIVSNPITMEENQTLGEALNLMQANNISSIPVCNKAGCVVGILTNRDVRFQDNVDIPVQELMTKELITVKEGIDLDVAKKLMHQHRIEKLIVVDDKQHCIGLITVNDIEKTKSHPFACKDANGRLRVAAAVGAGEENLKRAEALIEAGADVIVIDTAHGHSIKVIEQVKKVRALHKDINIIAGNIATPSAAKALIEAGADAVKVGIGPGSICTTRVVAGVGVPQLTAILECASICKEHNIPLIADGGVKSSGDLAKAIAAGADCVMIGSLLAGCDESPGEVFLYQGRSYKSYRGMGSAGAMARGSADRYFQKTTEPLKFVPEGVEGRVPYKGPLAHILHQLTGGLRSSMGYTGHGTIESMKNGCTMRRISSASLKESHVHDVTVTKEAPNYTMS